MRTAQKWLFQKGKNRCNSIVLSSKKNGACKDKAFSYPK